MAMCQLQNCQKRQKTGPSNTTDNTVVIAEGQISTQFNKSQHDGINITPTKTVIDILKVIVPNIIAPKNKLNHAVCLREVFNSILSSRGQARVRDIVVGASRPIGMPTECHRFFSSVCTLIVKKNRRIQAASQLSIHVSQQLPVDWKGTRGESAPACAWPIAEY